MLKLSPRLLLSPRFLVLPVIALAVIVALSQTSPSISTGLEMAGSKIYRAINCSDPAKATSAGCAVAGDQGRVVR
jgi:hypothetical protein